MDASRQTSRRAQLGHHWMQLAEMHPCFPSRICALATAEVMERLHSSEGSAVACTHQCVRVLALASQLVGGPCAACFSKSEMCVVDIFQCTFLYMFDVQGAKPRWLHLEQAKPNSVCSCLCGAEVAARRQMSRKRDLESIRCGPPPLPSSREHD